jgi:hypothetical protein
MRDQRPLAITSLALLIGGISFIAYSDWSHGAEVKGPIMPDVKRIFLIGASIGKEWNLKEFPKRVPGTQAVFESSAIYQFDKTEALEEILMRPKRKFHLTRTYIKGLFQPPPQQPDVIVIKECAAYFPGDLRRYKKLINTWVQRIRQAHLQAVLATVVPITKGRAEQQRDKIEAIWAYNDWIRAYVRQEQVSLLDLELAVRQDASNRYLREDLDNGDGLHLNKKAYALLDRLLQENLLPQISSGKGMD